ncbi:abortive infection family protein [Solibacillus isronensis]|uniref:abortive infection family protein n=1 Tax=Solibacillus isronensis TaxID=412383 RepID=UPI0039A02340
MRQIIKNSYAYMTIENTITMTLQIIKTNTNILNNFNTVRNEESFAHDNIILNKIESKLICNHVISLLKFIDELEKEIEETSIRQ